MSTTTRSINEILRDIKAAMALLGSAECTWEDVLQAAIPDQTSPEALLIEDLLHSATHKTFSQLAFIVHDVQALLERNRVRQKFSMFTLRQFQRILEQGWSTKLAQELHREFPLLGLAELSSQIKHLCTEWENLPKVIYKRRV